MNKNNSNIQYAPQDNTSISTRYIPRNIELDPGKRRDQYIQQFQQKANEQSQATITDKDKVDYYKNMQNFYNQNAFGYGIAGNQTRYNPSTQEGQSAIQREFDQAKDRAIEFTTNILGVGAQTGLSIAGRKFSNMYKLITKGVFKSPSKRGSLGTLKQYTKSPIGSGAEAIVVNNTPTTVGKITTIPVKEMNLRNAVPNSVESKYIGYVKQGRQKFPTYTQKKMQILTPNTFSKYLDKLDKSMSKFGYRKVTDPNVQYRAYTNGQIVIDDVAPGNVGIDWLRRPKMIDFNLQTVPEWLAQGFTLKKGGKFIYDSNKK